MDRVSVTGLLALLTPDLYFLLLPTGARISTLSCFTPETPRHRTLNLWNPVLAVVLKFTATEQKLTFQSIVKEVIGEYDDESDAIFMDIQDNLNNLIPVALEEEPEPKPVPVTKSTISSVLAESGVTEEQAAVIEQTYENIFGEDVPTVENLVDSKLVEANAKRKEKLELVQQVENLKQQLEKTRTLPVEESDGDDIPAVKTYDVILRVKPEKSVRSILRLLMGRNALLFRWTRTSMQP